ncbi:MAG: hypothetical protein JNK22_10275, partial [Rhodocyclaceae bacterium]|nr:hypothetical protein [Rhodocyclaceae bacterium]
MTTTRTARWIARALVLALLNPGFSLQALARDTDIYVNLNTSGISPPNVLLVLDTSDSMNTADDWREYPGAYDSHVEYLWNSTSIISAYPGSPTHGENASLIALGMAPISSISYSGTTATVTATAHGFSAGWAVTIANASESVYNGQFTITSVVDANTFTYTLPSAPAAAASTQTILASGKTVTSLTRSGSTVTATVTAHGFSTGNSVVIENASDAYYNGTFSITVTGANTFTYTISGSPASPATALSMYAASRNPDATSKYGFWGGKSPAEKRALWQAAYTYATGTESGDPGARSTYRNYDNANWIHWLPAGSAETDPRLRSVSFNRWAGGVKEISGLRGGITWASNDFRQYNKCSASLADLLPSTVFAPTTYPLNAGKYLNQRWMRWERFLDLATVNLASYPGVTANGNSALDAGNFRTGYVGWPADNSSPGGSPGDPTLAVPARDNLGGSSIGEAGQPIRIYQASSYSGWTDIRADMGGHIFQNTVAGAAGAVLTANRAIYGYPLILSNELFSAWLGNRDAGAAFGLQTGTPAYFDSSTTTAPYTTLGTCNPATGPASAFCRAETAGAAPAPSSRTIKTRTCVISGTNVLHYDARDQSRYYGGSCDQSGGITVSTTGPGPFPAAPAADPSACGFGSSPTDFYSVDNRSCAFQGTTVVEGSSPPLYTAAQCQGYARPVNTPDTAHPVNGALTTTACTPGGASGSYYSTCSDNADPNQTCAARFGGACNNNSCSNRTNYTETCVGGAAGTTAYYRTYQRQDRDDFLYHDCVADNATAGNPSNGYMRTAGVAWNTAYNTNAAGATASYVTAAGSGVGADASKNIDLYSVNYLNWKFGPKGPNGHPIGRKTRIQIAKDALSILVGNTNGIRLGLEVFNKTANAAGGFKAEGGNIARKVASMGARNCGVTSITGDIAAASEVVTVTTNPGIQQDDVLTIAGAGTAGGPLTATVVGIKLGESSSTYFVSLDAAASTTVVGATITLPACSGASTDTHNPTLPDYCPLTDPGCTRNSDWAQFNNRAGLVAAINAV